MNDSETHETPISGTGTPPPAVAANDAPAPPKTEPSKAASKGFNFIRHERVNKLRRNGLWAWLGEKFGLEVRLIPFYESRVVVRREAAEQAVRMQLSLGDDDPLPGEKAIEVNKIAVHEALVGVRGRLDGTPEILRIARERGLAVEGQQVVFNGTESEEAVKAVWYPIIMDSMVVTNTLARASREMFKLGDEVIDPLGEGFVYGRHVKAAWVD